MSIFLGHKTALWAHIHACRDAASWSLFTRKQANYDQSTSGKIELNHACKQLNHIFGSSPATLHVLVENPKQRRQVQGSVTHLVSKLPDVPLFMKIDEGLYIACPELCFVQMARFCTLTQLIELGFALCGGYFPSEDAAGFIKHNPLTSVSKLRTFVDGCKGVTGVKKAKRAVRYIQDGSRSPMESVTTMIFGLPRIMGGYGLNVGKLNYRVDLGERGRKVGKQETCYLDIAWPKPKFALEYNGIDYHVDVSRDEQRRLALQAEGWTVQFLGSRQLWDQAQRDEIVRMISRVTGKRLRKISHGCQQARRNLLSELRPVRSSCDEWVLPDWARLN